MIHPTAAAGFGSDAARYHRARPGYPDAMVDRVCVLADGPVLDLWQTRPIRIEPPKPWTLVDQIELHDHAVTGERVDA